MNRRGFLVIPLVGAVTGFVAKVQSRVAARVPILYGDGRHDDTYALNEWGAGRPVMRDGRLMDENLENGTFLISGVISVTRGRCSIVNNYFKSTPEFLERQRREIRARLLA